MKLRKLFAAIIAGAMAFSAMAINASAANFNIAGSNSKLMAVEGDSYIAYVNNDFTGEDKYKVAGFRIYLSGDYANAPIFGQGAANGPGISWTVISEWGANEAQGKPLVINPTDGSLTFQASAPFFTSADDQYMQIFFQNNAAADKTLTIEAFEYLAVDGSVMLSDYDDRAKTAIADAIAKAAAAAPAEEAPAEEATATEAPAEEAAPEAVEEAPAEVAEAPAAVAVVDNAPADPDEVAIVLGAPAADVVEDAVAEVAEAPAAEVTTVAANPVTGNTPAIVIASVMALAAVGMVVSKKRK